MGDDKPLAFECGIIYNNGLLPERFTTLVLCVRCQSPSSNFYVIMLFIAPTTAVHDIGCPTYPPTQPNDISYQIVHMMYIQKKETFC